MGKKGKGKKEGGTDNHAKFVPMPTHWPGKISQEDLFAEFAKSVRQDCHDMHQHEHVTLRIRQLDWNFHDFLLTVRKDATILQLKTSISKLQHGGSVSPQDIVIYKKNPKMLMEKVVLDTPTNASSKKSDRNSPLSKSPVELGKSIPLLEETIVQEKGFNTCDDMYSTIVDCFPEVAPFQVKPQAEEESEDAPEVLNEIQEEVVEKSNSRSSSAKSRKSKSRPSSSKRAKSAKSRTSVSSETKSTVAPITQTIPILGEASVIFIADLEAELAAHKSSSKVDVHAINIFYDVFPYVQESIDSTKIDSVMFLPNPPKSHIQLDIHCPTLMREADLDRMKRKSERKSTYHTFYLPNQVKDAKRIEQTPKTSNATVVPIFSAAPEKDFKEHIPETMTGKINDQLSGVLDSITKTLHETVVAHQALQ